MRDWFQPGAILLPVEPPSQRALQAAPSPREAPRWNRSLPSPTTVGSLEAPRLTVRTVPLDALHVDPANVRTHDSRNLASICASLKRFGQAEPLVVQRGTRRLIGGNGRWQAMKQLGWTECEIVELGLDDLQATALGIALNRTAELAGWDEPNLAKILAELREQDALDGVGYSTTDIDALVAQLRAEEVRELTDDGPDDPPAVAVAKLGDCGASANTGCSAATRRTPPT
jgi:hypothetical protein